MKSFSLIPISMLAVCFAISGLLTSCEPPAPTTPPRAEELPSKTPHTGDAPAKTLDQNGEVSAGDPARP